MQCGTPSVTTSIGAEGIVADGVWTGDIADESQEIVEASVALYTNKSRWLDAQEQGQKIINNRFAKPALGDRFMSTIRELQKDISDHRRHNFTGQMLMHHKSASTKYMSLWIEQKNN